MGGISILQLLIILAIVLLLFGTKKLRNLGGDLGGAIKGFRSAVREGESESADKDKAQLQQQEGSVIEGQAKREENSSKS